MSAPSLVEILREQGITLYTTAEWAAKEGYAGPNPHQCRGCGRWVDAKKLDEHAEECADPVRLARYRRSKASLGRRSGHLRFHVGRGVVSPRCALCRRAVQGRAAPRPTEEDWPEAAGR